MKMTLQKELPQNVSGKGNVISYNSQQKPLCDNIGRSEMGGNSWFFTHLYKMLIINFVLYSLTVARLTWFPLCYLSFNVSFQITLTSLCSPTF